MAKIKCPEGGVAYKLAGGDPVFIDPEFRKFLPDLEPKVRSILEEEIVEAGRVTDPITIWKETRIILDGHNRIEIATAKKISWKPDFKSFPNTPEGRNHALEWMLRHQKGRRNMTEEAMAKLAEFRRERVAEMRQAGESTRAIAKKEGVSQGQVMRDLKALTESGDSVEPKGGLVTSLDGSKRLSRAERVGQKPATPWVPKGERMPGDDTDQIKRDKKEARTNPKNGQVMFDWQAFESTFAKMMLMPDYLGKPYKANNSKEADALRKELVEWKKRFKTWYQTIAKQKAPKG